MKDECPFVKQRRDFKGYLIAQIETYMIMSNSSAQDFVETGEEKDRNLSIKYKAISQTLDNALKSFDRPMYDVPCDKVK